MEYTEGLWMLENGARVYKHPLRGSGAVPPGCELQGAEDVFLDGAPCFWQSNSRVDCSDCLPHVQALEAAQQPAPSRVGSLTKAHPKAMAAGGDSGGSKGTQPATRRQDRPG